MVKKKEAGEEETQISLKVEDSVEGEFIEEAVSLSADVPVKLVAVLGKKQIVLKDLLKMKVGQTIDLDRPPNEFVDLTANGKPIAKGELVEIDGKLGVRIIKMVR